MGAFNVGGQPHFDHERTKESEGMHTVELKFGLRQTVKKRKNPSLILWQLVFWYLSNISLVQESKLNASEK